MIGFYAPNCYILFQILLKMLVVDSIRQVHVQSALREDGDHAGVKVYVHGKIINVFQ